MSQPILFDYQQKAEVDIAALYRKGLKKVLGVMPGGSGKTILASSTTKHFRLGEYPYDNFNIREYSNQTGKKVAFFTHREELFDQAREKQLSFGNITEPINADTSVINHNAATFVCMVETFDRRSVSDSFLSYFKDVGLVFIDEAHRTDFNKILHHFDQSLFHGLTATPISTDKKQPLNRIWDEMYEACTVSQLQRLNSMNPNVGVVPCDCYSLSGIDRSKLGKKGDDFDEKKMSIDFRDKLQIRNTIEKYIELGQGLKSLCFNVDLDHNEVMHQEFINLKVPSRMLHSNAKKFYGAPSASLAKNWRKDTLLWFKNTPESVVNNVGILTTGYDEKSVENVMTNFSSLSISKVVQCHVRGARPFQYPNGEWKELYRWLDFGGNCQYFNIDGNNDVPWRNYYDMPQSTHNRDGVSGYKSCPECGSLNHSSTRFCKGFKKDWLSQELYECGYCFPITEKEEDSVPRTMNKFFSDRINVGDLVKYCEINGLSLGNAYYKILDAVCALGKKSFGTFILKEQFDFLLDIAFKKLKELSKHTGKRVWRDAVKGVLVNKMRSEGFVIDIMEIETK